MLPGVPVTLSADDLHQLIPAFRRPHPKIAECLEDLLERTKGKKDGGKLLVPDFTNEFGIDVVAAQDALKAYQGSVGSRYAPSLSSLAREATVRRDYGSLNTVLDYEEVLPHDLAPVVIADASGRVRDDISILG